MRSRIKTGIRMCLGALAAGLALTSIPAKAGLLLMVGNTTIIDNGAGDLSPAIGSISATFGSSLFTIFLDTGIASAGPSLSLASDLGSSTGPGTLVIQLTETGLTVPVSPWLTQLSGSFNGGSGAVGLQTFVDPSNTPFGRAIALANLSSSATPFALSSTNAGASGSLYSITEVLTITSSGAGRTFSVEGDLSPAASVVAGVPEPGAAALLGLGLAGMAAVRRRRIS